MLVFNVTDYMLLTYMPNYLSVTMGYAETKGLLLIIIVMLVMMPLNVVGGAIQRPAGSAADDHRRLRRADAVVGAVHAADRHG
ncbi:hypothetical protein [Sphingobium yanoikuyae]|uniref:hypothetical protein n=1 Tax=Sphingobium yanoikuyae TaxID=13690 RepID=UPI00345F1338